VYDQVKAVFCVRAVSFVLVCLVPVELLKTLIPAPLTRASGHLHSISSYCVSCGPFLFEASLVNLVFTESSSCVLKIAVGSCQYFFLMQYQETVLRVHFKEGRSFFSEEAKSPECGRAAL